MEEQGLLLIPKVETYIEYMLNLLIKLPRTEKFSIGNEYKKYPCMKYKICGKVRNSYFEVIEIFKIKMKLYKSLKIS